MHADFFVANRLKLVEVLKGGLVIIRAYQRLQRTNDEAHDFIQESNFWYLCGIEEPDWQLIIDGSTRKSYLVKPNSSAVHDIFDGSLSPTNAKTISGVDQVISADEGLTLLHSLGRKHSLVYTIDQLPHADSFNFSLNPAPTENRKMLERTFKQVQDCRKELASLRAIKQPDEISMIQKAINITIHAFNDTKQKLPSYKHEYEIEAGFSYDMRIRGANGHAYSPIVASGKNACTLHYSHNNSRLTRNNLVLMDVGASFGGYAADITRTYAHGSPSKRQIQIHTAVESAHQQIIKLISPNLSVEEYQRTVDSIMVEALNECNLYKGEDSLRRYFPHAISHGLGIDVHDSLGRPHAFQENMVLTVEPGIYIPEEGIGVRIEDDILVTSAGNRNLSAKLSTGL